MDTFLGCLAFAGLVLCQAGAVVAIHAERQRRHPNVFDAKHLDRRARVIWESGS